ncbi:hypothetical protein FRC09_017414 [Ceratobasidium sp. 395]|nr:hypothetical protein FRC09_017414 [Ceratobasidium sp. 395]
MEPSSIVRQLPDSPENNDLSRRLESQAHFCIETNVDSDSLYSIQSDELDEFIEELILHLRKQTEREEALVTLARLFSVVTDMEDLELWIYRSYVTLCMPKSNEIEAYSNSELVKMFGQVTRDSYEITRQHYDGTIAWLQHSASVLLKDSHQDNLVALDQARICLNRGIKLSSTRHKLRPSLYSNLARVYLARFRRLGELKDLNDALEYQSEAVTLVPSAGDDPLSALYYSELSRIYMVRFQRLDKLDDISQATGFQCRAISCAGSALQGNLPNFYARLGDVYDTRYQRFDHIEDIQNALSSYQTALFLAEKYGQDLESFYRGLGTAYCHRFDRLDNEADIEKAIHYFEQAVEAASDDVVSEKANCFSELGAAYRARFRRSGSQEDINASISCHTQGLLLLPDDHPAKPMTLFRLGSSFHSKADYSGEMEYIDRAISYHIQAL